MSDYEDPPPAQTKHDLSAKSSGSPTTPETSTQNAKHSPISASSSSFPPSSDPSYSPAPSSTSTSPVSPLTPPTTFPLPQRPASQPLMATHRRPLYLSTATGKDALHHHTLMEPRQHQGQQNGQPRPYLPALLPPPSGSSSYPSLQNRMVSSPQLPQAGTQSTSSMAEKRKRSSSFDGDAGGDAGRRRASSLVVGTHRQPPSLHELSGYTAVPSGNSLQDLRGGRDVGGDREGSEGGEAEEMLQQQAPYRELICLCSKAPRVPRPRNAFILYRQHHQAAVASQHPGLANPEISKLIGEQWRAQPAEIKVMWKRLAEEEKLRHARQYPDYRYQPRRGGKHQSFSNGSTSPNSSDARPSAEDPGRCAKCGGRYIATPRTPSTPYPGAGNLGISGASAGSMAAAPMPVPQPPTPITAKSPGGFRNGLGRPPQHYYQPAHGRAIAGNPRSAAIMDGHERRYGQVQTLHGHMDEDYAESSPLSENKRRRINGPSQQRQHAAYYGLPNSPQMAYAMAPLDPRYQHRGSLAGLPLSAKGYGPGQLPHPAPPPHHQHMQPPPPTQYRQSPPGPHTGPAPLSAHNGVTMSSQPSVLNTPGLSGPASALSLGHSPKLGGFDESLRLPPLQTQMPNSPPGTNPVPASAKTTAVRKFTGSESVPWTRNSPFSPGSLSPHGPTRGSSGAGEPRAFATAAKIPSLHEQQYVRPPVAPPPTTQSQQQQQQQRPRHHQMTPPRRSNQPRLGFLHRIEALRAISPALKHSFPVGSGNGVTDPNASMTKSRGPLIAVEASSPATSTNLIRAVAAVVEKALRLSGECNVRIWEAQEESDEDAKERHSVTTPQKSNAEDSDVEMDESAKSKDGHQQSKSVSTPSPAIEGSAKSEDTGKAVPQQSLAAYMTHMLHWHRASEEIVQHLTGVGLPAKNPEAASNALDASSSEPERISIALVPSGYSLTMSDRWAAASLTSSPNHPALAEAYNAEDHKRWITTLWRGIVGADLSVVVVTRDNLGADASNVDGGGLVSTVEFANAGMLVVRVNGSDTTTDKGRASHSRSSRMKIELDEKLERRLGFEIIEWVRNGSWKGNAGKR